MPWKKPAVKFRTDSGDKRCLFEVRPGVPLEDYSGPFRSDLRLTDFSRRQLANMYNMVHQYHYVIMGAYMDHINKNYGYEAMCDARKFVWCRVMPKVAHDLNKQYVNIKGDSLEDFMKAWQIDLNSMPGRYFDITFEMPDENRGVVIINRCPVVEKYEASGQTDKIKQVCASCPTAIENTARIHDFDIEVATLAQPPRRSKDHICCAFQVHIRPDLFDAATKGVTIAEIDLKIDKSKKDKRLDLEVDPNAELKDYSGPFKPDLKMTDFSRVQLAKLYSMATEYDVLAMLGFQQWCLEHHGYEAMTNCANDVWGGRLPHTFVELNAKYMNYKKPYDIETYMKHWQTDLTGMGPRYYSWEFQKVDKHHAIVLCNKCIAVEMMEPLGAPELLHQLCEKADIDCIRRTARIYDPDLDVKHHFIPPRENEDGGICCKWELFYESKGPLP